MNYEEVLEYLFSQLPMYQRLGAAAYKGDLDTTLALDEYFNHPHQKYKCVHITGTNGKGSVSHMLASVLQQAGYKTGLYTSPHLKDFRERIRINGEKIPESVVIEFTERHKGLFEELRPSFFEMTVAMAFDYFAEEEVDIAVVEVGMGGRLDSTNIITPLVSVITNIGFDHTAFLGDSLAKIAGEKAGIIKKNVPVVIGERQTETTEVFIRKAKEVGAEIFFASDDYNINYALRTTDDLQTFTVYREDEVVYQDLSIDMLGFYQTKNVVTVLKSVDLLRQQGVEISREQLYSGVRNTKSTGLLGRWQILDVTPLSICDTAHNESGIKLVLEQIEQTPHKLLHIVFGMVNDKNIDTVLGMLPVEASYYFTKAKIPRALDENILASKAKMFGLKGITCPSVEEAYACARSVAGMNDMIFVGGSTFIVAELV